MKLEILITGEKTRLPKDLAKQLGCKVEIVINKGSITKIGRHKGKKCPFYIAYVEIKNKTNFKKIFQKLKKLKIETDEIVVNLEEDNSTVFQPSFLKMLIKNKLMLQVLKFPKK